MTTVTIYGARYLGGYDRRGALDCSLSISPKRGVKVIAAGFGFTIPWDQVAGFEASVGDGSSNTTIPRLLLTGPFALGWRKNTPPGGALVVNLRDGRRVWFNSPKMGPAELEAKLSALAPFLPPPMPAPPPQVF